MAGLADVKVRSAKPREQVMKLSDGGDLQLWVTPAGGKHWKFAYRFEGRQKKLGIGPYPAIGLADARDSREKAKALLAKGVDPNAHAKTTLASQAQVAAATFDPEFNLAETLTLNAAIERAASACRRLAKDLRLVSKAPALSTGR